MDIDPGESVRAHVRAMLEKLKAGRLAGVLLFSIPLDLGAAWRSAAPGKGRTLPLAADLPVWVH